MPKVTINDTQGLVQATGTGVYTTALKHTAVVTGVPCAAAAGDSDGIKSWTQPANTLITAIHCLCLEAPTIGQGNIATEVGTVSGNGEIVAFGTDNILDDGTTVVVGAYTSTTLVQVAESGTTHAVSAQYTASDRSIYFNIKTAAGSGNGNASAAGAFSFIVEYIQFA